MKRALAHILAGLGGAAVWIATCRATGQVEAWDDPVYARAAFPVLAALVALLGGWIRERPAGLGITASIGQLVGLSVTRGGDAMWPVDVGILCLLALLTGLSARIGAGMRALLGGAVRLGRRAVTAVTAARAPTPPRQPTAVRHTASSA
jgi:hypothetical protein